jgi:putative transposase
MPDWPHAPLHDFSFRGAYMVTAATYRKQHHLRDAARLDRFADMLVSYLQEAGAELHAWALFSNHYHAVVTPSDPPGLRTVISALHEDSAKELNRADSTKGRKVWYQFWETALTFEKSYLARLKYVHFNAVHHGLVRNPSNYRWCSAAWFEREARPSFVKTVYAFKVDRINVYDEYEPVAIDEP